MVFRDAESNSSVIFFISPLVRGHFRALTKSKIPISYRIFEVDKMDTQITNLKVLKICSSQNFVTMDDFLDLKKIK